METNKNKIPDIAFIYPENYCDEKISDEIKIFKSDNLDIRIIKKNNGIYNGFEWIIPTAFGAYILKPYFDAFLSEAGKDHYNILKKGLKLLIEKGKEYRTRTATTKISKDKLSTTYSQSLTISIEFQTTNNRHLILLFDNNLDLTQWQNSLNDFLELLSDNYINFPNDKITIEIEKLNTKEHKIIYVIINPKTKELEFKDDKKMLEKYK